MGCDVEQVECGTLCSGECSSRSACPTGTCRGPGQARTRSQHPPYSPTGSRYSGDPPLDRARTWRGSAGGRPAQVQRRGRGRRQSGRGGRMFAPGRLPRPALHLLWRGWRPGGPGAGGCPGARPRQGKRRGIGGVVAPSGFRWQGVLWWRMRGAGSTSSAPTVQRRETPRHYTGASTSPPPPSAPRRGRGVLGVRGDARAQGGRRARGLEGWHHWQGYSHCLAHQKEEESKKEILIKYIGGFVKMCLFWRCNVTPL